MRTWWLQFRLQRVERKLKRQHFLQKRVRQQIGELQDGHRKGTIPEDRYREKISALEAKRSQLTQEVNRLLAEEQALKGQLTGAQA